MKSYLLPLVFKNRGFEPRVIKKANQFVHFKFGDVQLLDILSSLGGATSLDFFLKAYKTPDTKRYFLYEWFIDPEKLNNAQLLPYNKFVSKLRKNNPLQKDYSDFQNLIGGGLTSAEAS